MPNTDVKLGSRQAVCLNFMKKKKKTDTVKITSLCAFVGDNIFIF